MGIILADATHEVSFYVKDSFTQQAMGDALHANTPCRFTTRRSATVDTLTDTVIFDSGAAEMTLEYFGDITQEHIARVRDVRITETKDYSISGIFNELDKWAMRLEVDLIR